MTARLRIEAAIALAVLAAAIPVAPAAEISIVGTAKGYVDSTKSKLATAHLGTTLLSYDATGVDKLVIAIGSESGFNNNTIDITSLEFEGVALTQIVQENSRPFSDGGTAEIWYLDAPYQGAGTFTFSYTTSGGSPNGGIAAIIGLAGTADGAAGIGDTDATNWHVAPITSTITTTADNSLVIAMVENSGNNNGSGTPTVNSPMTQITNGYWGSQWAGVAVGYQFVPTSGTTITPTFTTNNGETYNIHTVAAEFKPGAPPRNLTLRVDPVTGATTLLGDPTRPIAINYYEITSDGDSLDSVNWSSLADQDFEGSGPPNGTGNGWEEAGGVGKHALAEAFLLGNSTIGASASVCLGRGYDAFVGAEDLVFTYLTDSGVIIEGLVEYVTSVLPGDANWDGVVDAADYIALKRSFGMASGARYQDGDFDGDHDVDWDDLVILQGSFGQGTGGTPTIPEPGSAMLLVFGAAALLRRRASIGRTGQ